MGSSGVFPGRIPASGKRCGVAGHPGMQAAAKHLANPHGQEKKEGGEKKKKSVGWDFQGIRSKLFLNLAPSLLLL